MSKKKVDIRRFSIIAIGVHLAFCLSASLLLKAENFPVVWRYSMFMNAPHSLAISSLILALILAISLHMILKGITKGLANYNFGIYYIEFVAVFAFLFLFTQLGLIINGAYDKSASTSYTVKVVNKGTNTYRGSTHEYIYLQDWRNPEGNVQVPVQGSRYRETKPGDYIQVETKKGVFGYEGIVNHREIMYSP